MAETLAFRFFLVRTTPLVLLLPAAEEKEEMEAEDETLHEDNVEKVDAMASRNWIESQIEGG